MSVLRLEGVRAGYNGRDVLHDIAFAVEAGECLYILGPNGCGKTTLLRAVAGLVPSSGVIELGGERLASMRRRDIAVRVALLSQMSQAYFAYTVYDAVMMGRYVHLRGAFRTPAAADRERVRACLETVGLWPERLRRVDTLSGGQLQRVFLARTLAQEPQVILLDEPTNHLDLKHQTALMDALRQWSRGENRAVVGVLHDLNLAISYASRLLLMREGKVYAHGQPEEVLESEILRTVFDMDVTAYMKRAFARWSIL